jgi:hypothetical protein
MRSIGLFLTGLALLSATAGAQAVTSPCETEAALNESLCRAGRPLASIRMSAASPHAGSLIDLDALGDGRRITFAWDLDGDGDYDDATGKTVTRAFTTGMRTVGVRATDQFGRTSTEMRSFVVHEFNLVLEWGVADIGEPITVRAFAHDPDGRAPKVELDLDGDGAYEVSSTEEWLEGTARFTTAGAHVVLARVTDDTGATATASAPVQVARQAPGVGVIVWGDDYGRPVVAGQPADVWASQWGFNAVRWEFDLDGDGTYETDRGTQSRFVSTFTAGEHEVGVRATDAAGATLTSRASLWVVTSRNAQTPWLFMQYEPRAYTGEPIDLQVEAFPEYRPYTLAWDADGDGAFDDGTFTTAGGSGPVATEGHNTFTYIAPGVYDVRVKVTDVAGESRVEHSTINVVDREIDGPAFPSLWLSDARPPGQEWVFEPRAAPGSTLTFGLQAGRGTAHDRRARRTTRARSARCATRSRSARSRPWRTSPAPTRRSRRPRRTRTATRSGRSSGTWTAIVTSTTRRARASGRWRARISSA